MTSADDNRFNVLSKPADGVTLHEENYNFRQLKISYTRDFLLSVAELDTCKNLPLGFDSSSILCEYDDASKCILNRQTVLGGVTVHGSRGSDSDSGRNYSSEHRYSWKNSGHDGILGCGNHPRVSRSSAGRGEENVPYLLTRSNEPYRPPCLRKGISQSRKENNDSYSDETFGSIKSLSQEREAKETWRKDLFELMRQEQKKTIDEIIKETAHRCEENYESNMSTLSKDSQKDKRNLNRNKESEEFVSPQASEEKSVEPSLAAQTSAPQPHSRQTLTSKGQEKNMGSGSLTNIHASERVEVQCIKRSSSSSKFAHWFHEEENNKPAGYTSFNSENSGPITYGVADGNSSGNKSPIFSDGNELTVEPAVTFSTSIKDWIPEQHCSCNKPSVARRPVKCEDLEESIPSEFDEKTATLQETFPGKSSDLKNDQSYSFDHEGASCHLHSLLQNGASPKGLAAPSNSNLGSSSKFAYPSYDNSNKKYYENIQKSLPLEVILETSVTKELARPEGLILLEDSIGSLTKNNVSEANGSLILGSDKVLYPSAAYKFAHTLEYYQGITNNAEQTDLKKFENQLGLVDSRSIGTDVQIQRETELSPICGTDEKGDSLDDICLPDEDSLITIDDQIMPQHPIFEPDWRMNHVDLCNSKASADTCKKLAAPNVGLGHKGFDLPGMQSQCFLHGSYDAIRREAPYIILHEKKPYQTFCQPEVDLVRPFVYPKNWHQSLLSSQSKLKTPMTYPRTPLSPYHHSPKKMLPNHFQNIHHEPTWFDIVQDSLLQQIHMARSFPHLENGLPRGTPIHHSVNHSARYSQELTLLPNFPLNHHLPSYAGLGTANLDPRVGGRNQVAFNRFMEMDLQATHMQSLSMAGHNRGMQGDSSELAFGMENRPSWCNRWAL